MTSTVLGLRKWAAVAGWVWAAAPAALAEPPVPAPGTEITEIEVTGSRLEALATDSPVAVDIVDREALAERSPPVLTEALRGESGVHVQSTTPGQGSPYIRGLTGSAVLNLVDGMRLNHAIYRSAPNPYLALIDPYIVDSVAVFRGPRSELYGSDAMGGLVQVKTRRPRFAEDEWEVRGALIGQFGSADLSRGGRGEVEVGRRGLGVRLGASGLVTEDLRAGSGTEDHTAYSWWAADAALSWEPTAMHRTTIDVQFLEQPETPRADELVAGFGQDEPSSGVWQYEPLARFFVHGRHEIRGIVPSWLDAVVIDVAFQRIDDDRRTRAFESPIEVREHNRSELFGVTARGASTAGERLSLEWGAEAYFDDVSSRRRERDLATGTATAAPSRFPDGATMNSYGVFAKVAFDPIPTLRLTGGLRYSHFDIDVPATTVTGGNALHLDDVTGGVGILWAVRPSVRLATNFHRGFRAPNIFDLGTLGARPGNRFNIPSSDLDAEVAYTVDAGVKLVGERLRGALFGFYTFYDDKIESVLTGDTTADGRDVVQSANMNEVDLTGFEAWAEFDLTPDWLVAAQLFYVWGEERGPDGSQPADRIPPLQGQVSLRWQPRENLWLEPFVRFAAEQDRLSERDVRDPRVDPTGTDGWATLNARAGWSWRERFRLVLTLENLTDLSYREHGSGVDAPGVGVHMTADLRF